MTRQTARTRGRRRRETDVITAQAHHRNLSRPGTERRRLDNMSISLRVLCCERSTLGNAIYLNSFTHQTKKKKKSQSTFDAPLWKRKADEQLIFETGGMKCCFLFLEKQRNGKSKRRDFSLPITVNSFTGPDAVVSLPAVTRPPSAGDLTAAGSRSRPRPV